MRYRTRSTLSPLPLIKRYALDPSCSTDTYWDQSLYGMAQGTYEEMYDAPVANFRDRQQRGEIFFNPMSRLRYTAVSSGGDGPSHQVKTAYSCSPNPSRKNGYRWDGPYFEYLVKGTGTMVPSQYALSAADISDAVVQVSTALAGKRGKPDSNTSETVAELGSTFKMLNEIRSKFVKVLMGKGRDREIYWPKVSHKVRTFVKELPADVASNYLMIRYGIMPLVRDVETILQGLQKDTGKVRQTIRSGLTIRQSLNSVQAKPGGGFTEYDLNISSIDTMVIRGMSLDEYVVTVGNNIGFSAKGLLTLPYELITLSFVVDWFANVGDYINACVPAFGWNQLGSCVVTERTVETTYTPSGSRINAANAATYELTRPHSGSVRITLNTVDRGTLPSPKLLIKADFGFDQVTRVADATAILYQQLRNLKK